MKRSLHVGWFVLCENAVVDNPTNNISIFTCIENMEVSALPAVMPSITFVFYLFKDDQQDLSAVSFKYRVMAKPPEGDAIQLVFGEVNESPGSRFRVRHAFRGLRFEKVGTRWFTLEIDTDGTWAEVGRLPLTIEVRAPVQVQVQG